MQAVKETLAARGVIAKVECQIRSEVIKALKQEEADEPTRVPQLSSDCFLINELIKEYLLWKGLVHTADTLVSESGQPKAPMSRPELEKLLRVQSGRNAAQVPLLYSVVASVRSKK